MPETPPVHTQSAVAAGSSIRKHSKLGLVSFVLSLVGVLAGVTLVIVAMAIAARNPGPPDAVKSRMALIGMLGILPLLAHLAAVFLGIGSMFFHGTKKTFGAIGLGISGLTIAAVGGLAAFARPHQLPRAGAMDTAAPASASTHPASNPLATTLRPGWQGLPVFQIAPNDNIQMTVQAAKGVLIGGTALSRLRTTVTRQFEDKIAENAPTDLAKQFLVAVSVKKYAETGPTLPGYRDLDLMVDVRVLPGEERVCYFGVGEKGGPELSDASLERKAAADAAKCLADPRMWVRPEKVLPEKAPAQTSTVPKRDTSM